MGKKCRKKQAGRQKQTDRYGSLFSLSLWCKVLPDFAFLCTHTHTRTRTHTQVARARRKFSDDHRGKLPFSAGRCGCPFVLPRKGWLVNLDSHLRHYFLLRWPQFLRVTRTWDDSSPLARSLSLSELWLLLSAKGCYDSGILVPRPRTPKTKKHPPIPDPKPRNSLPVCNLDCAPPNCG